MVYSSRSASVVLLIISLGGMLAAEGVAVASEPAQVGDTLEEKLDRVVAQSLDSHPVPGLAVGVIKGGKVVYAKGFGVLDIRADEPVTTESLFHVASLSKTFVATAIMQLVERKDLGLDDPVAKYLPFYESPLRVKHFFEAAVELLLGSQSSIRASPGKSE